MFIRFGAVVKHLIEGIFGNFIFFTLTETFIETSFKTIPASAKSAWLRCRFENDNIYLSLHFFFLQPHR